MSDKLELKVVFAAVDKFLRPVKNITDGAKNASKALKDTKDELAKLNRTAAQIDAFQKLDRDIAITANAFKGAQTRVAALKAEMAATATPTKAMTAELEKASRAVSDLKAKHESLVGSQQKVFAQLKEGGIDTRNLAQQRMALSEQTVKATNASRQLSAALEAENQKMKRLHAARAQLEKSKELAGKLATTGAGMAAGGAAVALPIAKITKDYADFETAMLGVARQVDGAKDANGRYTRSYFEMGDAIKAMAERLPLSANEIAKIVEGGARMGIQGKENLLIFAKTTAVMASAFDLPVEQIGDDIGKISMLYKVPIKDIESLGDTINYLDDNAQSKGKDIIEVMKRIAGTADMVKMNFREAAALGSTFLSLGAAPDVAATASKAMIRELSIATMQTKRFRGGLEMLKMDAKAIQLGMNKDATGTIIKVLEAIKRLPEEKQLEAATRLFGKEYGDDASNLASNLGEYRRQLKLVNEEKARGSMGRESDTRNATLNARLEMSKNTLMNLSSALGEHLKPAIVETLDKTIAIIQAVRTWSQENPRLSGGLITAVKWLALLLTVLGAGAIAFGAVIVPMAAMKFALATLTIAGTPLAAILGAVAAPIAAVAAGLALGAAAGYAFNAAIDWVVSKFVGHKTTLGAFVFDVVEMFRNGEWTQIGGYIIKGIEAGIDFFTGGLYSKVKGLALGLAETVKSALGIQSPSKVFAELGGFTMQGFEKGLAGGEDGPLSAVAGMAKKLAGIGAGVAISGAAMAGEIPLDMRPPIAAAAMMGGGGGNTYQITIHAAPGTDNAGLAALVAREIERIEAQKAARHRGRLRDSE